MVDVSIVIVNWNTRDLLLKCIESLKIKTQQTKIEIIVSDNNSSDDSAEAVKKHYPDVTVLRNASNLGFAKANNVGIRFAKGKYICLVNSDIELVDDVVDKLYQYIETHNNIGAIGPQTVNADMSIRKNCREFPTLKNAFNEALFLDKIFPGIKFFRARSMNWYSHNETRQVEVLSGCFLMVRKKVIEKIGMLDDRFFIYGEDVDWCKRISLAGWERVFYTDTKAIHYAGSSSANAPVRFLIERLKSSLQYWEKHHSHIELFIFNLILFINFSIRLIGWLLIIPLKLNMKNKLINTIKGYIGRITFLLFRKVIFSSES